MPGGLELRQREAGEGAHEQRAHRVQGGDGVGQQRLLGLVAAHQEHQAWAGRMNLVIAWSFLAEVYLSKSLSYDQS